MPDLKSWGPATVIVVALVTIVAAAGAVVVITNPQTLDFQHYVDVLVGAAVATGLLGIGRGHAAAAQTAVDGQALLRDLPPTPVEEDRSKITTPPGRGK